MKSKIPWLLISLLIVVGMLMASCGPKTSTGPGA
jgi:predicted small secreted protein